MKPLCSAIRLKYLTPYLLLAYLLLNEKNVNRWLLEYADNIPARDPLPRYLLGITQNISSRDLGSVEYPFIPLTTC